MLPFLSMIAMSLPSSFAEVATSSRAIAFLRTSALEVLPNLDFKLSRTRSVESSIVNVKPFAATLLIVVSPLYSNLDWEGGLGGVLTRGTPENWCTIVITRSESHRQAFYSSYIRQKYP